MYKDLILEHVPGARLICEPTGRNTAPSIGLAAVHLLAEDPDAIMIVLPADHSVADEAKLVTTLNNAVALADAEDLLVTIGVEPTYANTGYGYIRRGARLAHSGFTVNRFFEKPNLERAQQYFESGNFYWNSGMFIWRAATILATIRDEMPELHLGLMKIAESIGTPNHDAVLAEIFPTLENISIDFGILEHARNCAVVASESFGWNDIGSWDAWAQHFEKDADGNLQHGDTLIIDSVNCVVNSEKRFTAVLGAEDLVVIDSPDALLVCPRSRVQDVRAIVEELKRRGRTQLV